MKNKIPFFPVAFLALIFTLFSCSTNLSSGPQVSVVFPVQELRSADSARDLSSEEEQGELLGTVKVSLYVNEKLFTSKEENFYSNTKEVIFDFENIPVRAQVYAAAEVYINNVKEYTGESEKSTVTERGNELSLTLYKIYTVSFDSGSGRGITTPKQRITDGETASEPDETPVKEKTYDYAYRFDGWYTSDDGGVTLSSAPFDFATPITGNLTLYAKWLEIPYYSVVFDANGGVDAPALQRVLSGELATEPAEEDEPTKTSDGKEYAFAGWYTSQDEGATLADATFDFETPINGNITLYAKWNVKVAVDGYEVEIPVDQIQTINVEKVYDASTGSYAFTADTGYDTYLWKFDGQEKDPATDVSYSTTNVLTISVPVAPGYYDVTLLATKVIDGVTKYYSYYTQIKKD